MRVEVQVLPYLRERDISAKTGATRSRINIERIHSLGNESLNPQLRSCRENSEVSKYSDIDICTQNGKYSDRVQELHTLIIHVLVELVEDLMF